MRNEITDPHQIRVSNPAPKVHISGSPLWQDGFVSTIGRGPWFSPASPPSAIPRPAARDEGLALSSLPRGFDGVDAADGSIAYRGSGNGLAQRLAHNQVRVVAIRHGQSQSNADSEQTGQPLLYGRSESPLTAKGIQQARDCAAEFYRQMGGDSWMQAAIDNPSLLPVFCSSTVSRALDSAQIIADHLTERALAIGGEAARDKVAPWLGVHREPRLLESSFGRFETRPLSELQRAYPEFTRHWRPPEGRGTDFRHRFPGGESRADVMRRMEQFFESVARKCAGRTVVMLTHGEAVLAARAALGQAPQVDGKVRAETGAVGNAVPYWMVGQPTVPPSASLVIDTSR